MLELSNICGNRWVTTSIRIKVFRALWEVKIGRGDWVIFDVIELESGGKNYHFVHPTADLGM